MQCKNEIKIGSTLRINLQRVSGETPVSLANTEITSAISHPKFGRYELDVEVTEPEEGRVLLVLDADTTARMIPGDYVWDISFTDSDGITEKFPKNNKTILTFIKGPTQ